MSGLIRIPHNELSRMPNSSKCPKTTKTLRSRHKYLNPLVNLLHNIAPEGFHASQDSMAKSDDLCGRCRGLNMESLRLPHAYHHSPRFTDVIASAQTCMLCRLIASDGQGRLPDRESTNTSSGPVTCSLGHNSRPTGNYQSMTVRICYNETSDKSAFFKYINMFTDLDDPAIALGLPVRPSLSNTASQSSFNIAQIWLQQCMTLHKCVDAIPFLKQHYSNDGWPARLVDVDAFPGPNGDVCLAEMKGPSQAFIALSYCWGSNDALHKSYITTLGNLASRSTRIDFSSLPQTLQDAITITRRFGIRYIWIDALCIIQDSDQDWQNEASKMGTIYSQAVLTIAADAGIGCESGCFNSHSKPLLSRPSDTVRVTSMLSDGRQSSIYFYKEWLEEDFVFTKAAEIDGAPLQSRGWTYQERMLSSRILHFGANMLYWECRKCFAAEEYFQLQYRDDGGNTVPGYGQSITQTRDHMRTTERQTITRWYRDVVEEYSRRSLTKGTDKLPAISAVAKVIHVQTDSQYLAGLWLHNLQYGLYWKCVGPVGRPASYIAPSFTWTSVENAVRWNEDMESYMIPAEFEVLDFHIQAKGSDFFSSISSGWLKLSGHILTARLKPYAMPFSEFNRLAYRRGLREEDVVMPNSLFVMENGDCCGHAYVDGTPVEEEVTCLFLRHARSDSDKLQVLLLTPSSSAPGEYQRKGVGSFLDFPGDWETRFKDTPRTSITIV